MATARNKQIDKSHSFERTPLAVSLSLFRPWGMLSALPMLLVTASLTTIADKNTNSTQENKRNQTSLASSKEHQGQSSVQVLHRASSTGSGLIYSAYFSQTRPPTRLSGHQPDHHPLRDDIRTILNTHRANYYNSSDHHDHDHVPHRPSFGHHGHHLRNRQDSNYERAGSGRHQPEGPQSNRQRRGSGRRGRPPYDPNDDYPRDPWDDPRWDQSDRPRPPGHRSTRHPPRTRRPWSTRKPPFHSKPPPVPPIEPVTSPPPKPDTTTTTAPTTTTTTTTTTTRTTTTTTTTTTRTTTTTTTTTTTRRTTRTTKKKKTHEPDHEIVTLAPQFQPTTTLFPVEASSTELTFPDDGEQTTVEEKADTTKNNGKGSNKEELGGINDYSRRTRKPMGDVRRDHQKNLGLIMFIILAVLFVLIAVVITMAIIIYRQRKKKRKPTSRSRLEKQPRKMESADIYATKFAHVGALKMDRGLRGPVRHSLEGQTSTGTINSIQFDPNLNEIVDIGTNVENMTGGATEMESGHITDANSKEIAVKGDMLGLNDQLPKE